MKIIIKTMKIIIKPKKILLAQESEESEELKMFFVSII